MNLFETVLVQPLLNLFVIIYHQLIVWHIANALGLSIILLTFLSRLVLYPFMQQSLRQQKKMQAIGPALNKLKEKYKNDMKAQQAAQMDLFKKEGVNPASGCFLILIQFPILIGLYQVLYKVVTDKSFHDINRFIYSDSLKLKSLWDTHFFGLSLAQKPQEMVAHIGYVIVLVSIITGGLQMIQSKMMAQTNAEKAKTPKKDEPDFATSLQTQMLYFLPVMVGFFAFTLPFGLSLYWNTLTIFGIIQQYLVGGWGGLVDWLPFLGKKTESRFK